MKIDDRPDRAIRLQHAREARGFRHAKDAAKFFGWVYDTYIQHENGQRGIGRAASKYAKAFRVSEAWLLTGEGDDPSETLVPVLSMVSASNLRDQPGVTQADIERWIKVSDLPRGDWVALVVEGDSMDRVAPDGATIIVNRDDNQLLDGRYYVFSVDQGAATFKRYFRDPDRLQPHSSNPDHPSIPVFGELYVFGRVRRVIHDL